MATIWDRYTLITNLDYVRVGRVRTMTHALLVQRDEGLLFDRNGPRHMLRGFGTNSTLPTFDTVIPTDEFELVPARSADILIGEDDAPRPLFCGAIMKIAGMPIEVGLIAANESEPIDVRRFPEGTDINEVWEVLECKVAQHWRAPNMPLPQWVPAQSVRRRLGVRS